MGDYSSPIGMLDEGRGSSASGEFDTFNDLDKLIYTNFRSKIYRYTQDRKTGVKTVLPEPPNDDRKGWYHVVRYGDYDTTFVGYAESYNPAALERMKDNAYAGMFHGFKPDKFGVMFINQDVFKYLTRPYPKKETARDDRMEEYLKGVTAYRASSDKTTKDAMRMEMSGSDRFEFLDRGMHVYHRLLLDSTTSEETVLGIQNKLRQLWTLSSRMWNIQRDIRPSHGLAPQGGWHNDLSEMNNFHKKLVAIYEKHQRERE